MTFQNQPTNRVNQPSKKNKKIFQFLEVNKDLVITCFSNTRRLKHRRVVEHIVEDIVEHIVEDIVKHIVEDIVVAQTGLNFKL